jgi:hypothetical protein
VCASLAFLHGLMVAGRTDKIGLARKFPPSVYWHFR